MPALILAHDADGHIKGRCDQRCYDATWPRCRCICGGENHGCGLQTAAAQTLARPDADLLANDFAQTNAIAFITRSRKLAYYAHPRLFPTERTLP